MFWTVCGLLMKAAFFYLANIGGGTNLSSFGLKSQTKTPSDPIVHSLLFLNTTPLILFACPIKTWWGSLKNE